MQTVTKDISMRVKIMLMALIVATPLSAQQYGDYSGYPGHGGYGARHDFGFLETGVLPNGTEIPDITLDTLNPNADQPALHTKTLDAPPADLYDETAQAAPSKKQKRHY